MKKYKLIKTYPDSPVLNSTGYIDGATIIFEEPNGNVSRNSSTSGIDKGYFTNNSDNWKEIVEKDYEILSFKRDNTSKYEGTEFSLTNNGLYNPSFRESNLTLKHCLNGGFNIYSVKRLSDGEIFTVGDPANTNIENYGKIKSFEIVINRMYVISNNDNDHYTCRLEDLILIKKPLYIADDGGPIFEGDAVWGVDVDYFTPFYRIAKYNLPYRIFKLGRFSTKERAEEYIKINKKPLFITEDGVDVFEDNDGKFQYWSLNLNLWQISDAPHVLKNILPTKTEDLLRVCNELRFSTKEAAEEYILMNKQELSINDICTIKGLNMTNFREKLTEFIKNKK